jgi:uncharacterized protein (DUF2141 family)
MKVNPIILLLLPAFLLATDAKAQSYTIKVNITGLRSSKGTLYLSLYNSAEGYPQKASAAYRLSSAPITQGQSTILLDGIPAGTYAIACYHDENGNGKLDTNFFGVPAEGTGASNNARGSLGPPKFRDARFEVRSDTTQNIKIVY